MQSVLRHLCRREATPMALHGERGIFSHVRENPPWTPKRTRGENPSTPDIARFRQLKNCTRCAIGCGVHGFAMSPYDSFSFATAPYYREARVTTARRQTACRMRHYCTRRIDECLGRRKLGCTATRLAKRQRIIEAEASRIAEPMAVSVSNTATQAVAFRRQKPLRARDCQSKPFSWGSKGAILFHKREWPL